jgi:hypothetical protein
MNGIQRFIITKPYICIYSSVEEIPYYEWNPILYSEPFE